MNSTMKCPIIKTRSVFRQALNKSAVYVLRYELFDDLKSMPDIKETKAHRHMRLAKSIIGLFVVQQRRRGRRLTQKLKSVTIQMDYKQGMAVGDRCVNMCVCWGGGREVAKGRS